MFPGGYQLVVKMSLEVNSNGSVCGNVLGAMKTLQTDRFLIGAVQVVDAFENRYDKLKEIWTSVPRDPTKYSEAV